MRRSALLPRRTVVGAALALMALAAPATAQDKYPSKPVKIIVPYAPGGATDITARLFGEQLRAILGQQFVVESKPGAFGVLAIEEMARAKPDGYTLMIGNVSTNAITPVLFKSKFTVDFDKSVVSVSRLAIYPSFLITTTKIARREVGGGARRARQEEPRQGEVHQRRHRQLPAFRHGDLRQARRRRHGAYPEQGRRRRHDQRSRGRRRRGGRHQRRQHCRDDQGRQPAPDRGAGRGAARRVSRTSRHSPRPAIRASARCTGRACSRPPARRRRCSRPCTRRSSKPHRRPHCRRRSRSSWSASSPTRRSRRRNPGSRRDRDLEEDRQRSEDRDELKPRRERGDSACRRTAPPTGS